MSFISPHSDAMTRNLLDAKFGAINGSYVEELEWLRNHKPEEQFIRDPHLSVRGQPNQRFTIFRDAEADETVIVLSGFGAKDATDLTPFKTSYYRITDETVGLYQNSFYSPDSETPWWEAPKPADPFELERNLRQLYLNHVIREPANFTFVDLDAEDAPLANGDYRDEIAALDLVHQGTVNPSTTVTAVDGTRSNQIYSQVQADEEQRALRGFDPKGTSSYQRSGREFVFEAGTNNLTKVFDANDNRQIVPEEQWPSNTEIESYLREYIDLGNRYGYRWIHN